MLMNKKRFALLIALAVTALPLAAQAQRKSPLADAVAIRHRYELRSTRFEIGAGLGSTLNQDYFPPLWGDSSYPTVGTIMTNPSYSAVIKLTQTYSPNLLNESGVLADLRNRTRAEGRFADRAL